MSVSTNKAACGSDDRVIAVSEAFSLSQSMESLKDGELGLPANCCRLVAIGNETNGERISIMLADAHGTQLTLLIFPPKVRNGYQHFQRGRRRRLVNKILAAAGLRGRGAA
jgi:hypothetical protein